MQSNVSAYEVKSKRNITPLSGLTSTATSLILIYEDAKPRPIDHFDALVDVGPSQSLSAPPYR